MEAIYFLNIRMSKKLQSFVLPPIIDSNIFKQAATELPFPPEDVRMWIDVIFSVGGYQFNCHQVSPKIQTIPIIPHRICFSVSNSYDSISIVYCSYSSVNVVSISKH